MEKEIEINGKKVIVKEMGYIEGVSLDECTTSSEKIKKMMIFSTNLTEEEVGKILFKEGVKLQKLINEVNSFTETFRKPIKEETQK